MELVLLYQKNTAETKAHWIALVDGQVAKQFMLRPEEHGRKARQHAFREAACWLKLSFAVDEVYQVSRGTYSNVKTPNCKQVKIDWAEIAELVNA